MTAVLRLVAAALVVAVLQGCALLGKNERESAVASSTPPPVRTTPAYALDVDAPDDLALLLRQHLDLARFREVPEGDAVSLAEIDRLVAAAPAQARALLETEGYFGATVTARRTGDAAQPAVRVNVQPGAPARITAVEIDAEGELASAAAADDPLARETLAALRERWPLGVGERFRQANWTDAKNAAMAALRARAYPSAVWQATEARVDAATGSVRLRAVAASGPLFRLGPLRIEGLVHHDREVVERLADFRVGAPAAERTLVTFQERLQKVGLFESVQVDLDTHPDTAALAPVNVRLREAPLRQATVGVGVSANTGPRITLEHVHRRPLDLPWTAKNQIEFGGDRRAWQVDLVSHPVPGLYRNLVSGSVERLHTTDETRWTNSARIGRTQDTPRIERLYYAEVASERLLNAAGLARTSAVSANVQWVFRDLDSVLLPTDGQSLSAQAAAGYARSSTLDDGPFTRGQLRLTMWRPFGERWYATARLEAGQVWANDRTGVPDAVLFRAGGDESVRGYAYRSLGPVVDGVVTSGRALLTGSVEIARPISARLPSVWGAVFVDAGNAAANFGALRPVSGYGVGVRWRSPVGPLRVDLAYGHAVERLRLHLSVGIAF
jgi:translocation and assembly module TamA